MWLNGEEVPFEGSPRLQRCLKEGEFLSLYTKDPSIIYTINIDSSPTGCGEWIPEGSPILEDTHRIG